MLAVGSARASASLRWVGPRSRRRDRRSSHGTKTAARIAPIALPPLSSSPYATIGPASATTGWPRRCGPTRTSCSPRRSARFTLERPPLVARPDHPGRGRPTPVPRIRHTAATLMLNNGVPSRWSRRRSVTPGWPSPPTCTPRSAPSCNGRRRPPWRTCSAGAAGDDAAGGVGAGDGVRQAARHDPRRVGDHGRRPARHRPSTWTRSPRDGLRCSPRRGTRRERV